MQNRKRLFFIVLIILFLPGITAIYLQVKIAFIKYQAEERFEATHLQTVNIPFAEIQWIEKGKELMIRNRLFDVKKFHQHNTVVTVTGLFDDEESTAKCELGNLWQQQKSDHDIFLLHYFQIFGNACYQHSEYEINRLSTLSKTYHSDIVYYLQDTYLKIPSPPPQV